MKFLPPLFLALLVLVSGQGQYSRCDDRRVGLFCENTPCYNHRDCFSKRCSIYARCEKPTTVFEYFKDHQTNDIATNTTAINQTGGNSTAKAETTLVPAAPVKSQPAVKK